MRIGIDARELQKGKLTGIGRFLLDLVFFLSQKKPDWEVILFLDKNCELNFSAKNLNKIVLSNKFTFFFDQVTLLCATKKYGIQLFFSPYYKFPVLLDIPVVTTVFDILYLIVEPYKRYLKNWLYIKNFIKFTSQKVKKIITCSYTAKNDLKNIIGLDDEKIEVVYLAVSQRFKQCSVQEVDNVTAKYNITKNYILYVGNSKPHKNLARLIEVYTLLPDEIKNKYLLVLAGVNRKDIVIYRQYEHYLRVIEFIPDDDLPVLYSGAEVFVFPSVYEGFGLPPLEALSCGCPVVVSNIPSLQEVLKDIPVYFNPYDVRDMKNKILTVLVDKTFRSFQYQKWLQERNKFIPENVYDKYITVFENVCI